MGVKMSFLSLAWYPDEVSASGTARQVGASKGWGVEIDFLFFCGGLERIWCRVFDD